MKANELMIGDWVLINGVPRKIEAVDGVDNEIMADDEIYCLAEDRYHSEDKVIGIPITPEILEKNGFKWDTTRISQKLFCGSVHICWGFYKNCLSMSDWDDNGDTQITSIRCEYVHKLQHILRDCGIDKEIEL